MPNSKRSIFKNASTTYFYSSLFFPKNTWEEVATLYAYVRTADDFVDEYPQDIAGFREFILETVYWIRFYTKNHNLNQSFLKEAMSQKKSKYSKIIREFVELLLQKNIKLSWLRAFLQSMVADLNQDGSEKIVYKTRAELDRYIYGSADVIGLCMARILQLPKVSYEAAQLQGSAMQHINFIRDIAEDCGLNRQYLPLESLKKFGLSGLSKDQITSDKEKKFTQFIRSEIELFRLTQAKAEQGYRFIQLRYRVPIATAATLYAWTADQIYQNPMIVFQKKVKPSKVFVFFTIIQVFFRELFR